MRAWALLAAAFTLQHTTCASRLAEPNANPFLDTIARRSSHHLKLFKRQSCPAGHTSCSSLGDADACCPSDTVCSRDQNNNIACCPINAVCTGAIGAGSLTGTNTPSSSTPYVLGGTTTQSTPSSITPAASLAPGYSTLNNAVYPFLLIPTTFPNSQLCLSAYSSCQSASTACFNYLAGQNGVTISGLGTQGLTQAGVTGQVATGASGICSSLYQEGCFNVQTSDCSRFGSGSAGATQTTGFVQVNVGPAVARCTGAYYTAAAAVMAGVGVARIAMA